MRALVLTFLLSAITSVPTFAQEETAPAGRRGGGNRESKEDEIKPYDKVITKEAVSDAGLFLVHTLNEKVYFEIPTAAYAQEMLWVTQIARTQAGHGYGGTPVGNRVVRWEMKGKEVLLRDVKYKIRSERKDSARVAVDATSMEPIIQSFPVKAWGKDKAAVIDVTELFLGDLAEFSAKRALQGQSADRKRSFVEKIRSFPENIETKVLMTYKLGAGDRGGATGVPSPTPAPRRRGGRTDPSQGQVTALIHHSMVKLPEQPMQAREYDGRVGYFTVSFEDYGTEDHEVKETRYITRWRLEKKDPSEEVSEPKKPIVFYVGRGVPERWRAWVKKGIESWQPAFEAAGFKNAILAKDAPTEQEDPDWDPEDARYSSIRWLPSTVENAMGPHVHDPRTGEILEADIIMYHNVIKLCRDWYFVQASPNDPRAQSLPLPDDLMGELLAYVVSHEVGHSLGFPHNMKASSSYSVEQLRDPEFTAKNGTEASIMDYGRFNYVAQPGDGARLIPVIGPYDFFAVNWGYRHYKDADVEKKELLAEIDKQVNNHMLRFGDPNPGEDPSQQTEDLGSDPVRATELGLKNIDRIAKYLVKATCKEGEGYELLRNMYDQLLSQRDRELAHVASVLGGMVKNNLWFGQDDRMFEAVPSERQKEAIEFLRVHAFQTPKNLIDPEITLRLESSGAADRILRGQQRILGTLVSKTRIKRMAEHATRSPDDAYAPMDMLEDIRQGIWSELTEERVIVDLYRRNLQRAHVETLTKTLDDNDPSSDLPALSRGELKTILASIQQAVTKAADRATSMHLDDVGLRIRHALDPRKEASKDPAPPVRQEP